MISAGYDLLGAALINYYLVMRSHLATVIVGDGENVENALRRLSVTCGKRTSLARGHHSRCKAALLLCEAG
jgi:hypothetical protein